MSARTSAPVCAARARLLYVCLRVCTHVCVGVWVRLPMGSLFVAGFMMSLEAHGLGMRLRHIVRCTPGVRSASQPCPVYVQTSTLRAKRGRNSATAVLVGMCLARRTHLIRLLLATRGDCVAWRILAQVSRLRSRCRRGAGRQAVRSPRRLAERKWRSLPSTAASPFRAQKWRHAVLDSGAAPRWAGPEC